MYSKLELEQYEKAVSEIQTITRIYEEAALLKINQVRVAISKIDQFLKNLKEVYSQTAVNLKSDKKSEETKKKGVALVFISSQRQAYGSLIVNIYRQFIAEVKKTGFEAIVIGAQGRRLMEEEGNFSKNVIYFDLDDDNPSMEQIKRIVECLSLYRQLIVFYGEFVSLLTQIPKKSIISETISTEQLGGGKKSFLYEPRETDIIREIKKEESAAQFIEKLYESQIARVGAKIKIVEVGQVALKIAEVISDIDKTRIRVRKKIANKKQMEIFCGYNLWS